MQMLQLGNSLTQEIINGKVDLKDFSKDELKTGFKDYLDSIDNNNDELDLDKEMAHLENNWKLSEITNLEQRHKDPFSQNRKKWQLRPI